MDLEEQERKRDQQVTALQRQVAACKKQVTDQQGQVTVRDQRVTDIQGQLAANNEQVVDLQRQLGASNEQVTDLLGQLEDSNKQVADLQRQLTASNAQVGRLRELVTTLDGTNSSENTFEMQRDWKINRNEKMFIPDELLGQGAWGRVFRGKFRRCDVAVKEIHQAILSPLNRSAFEREVGIASRCRHPCLLQCIGATNDEEGLLLVTELMDRSLRSLYDERLLTERDVSVISLDVAQVLNYLHQNKPDPIIHRDISSANVLLWRQGDDWRGKVSDYGTAKFVRQCRIEDPGAAIYCAPEAIVGPQDQIISCKVGLDKKVAVKRMFLK